jgi:hypothetical protein
MKLQRGDVVLLPIGFRLNDGEQASCPRKPLVNPPVQDRQATNPPTSGASPELRRAERQPQRQKQAAVRVRNWLSVRNVKRKDLDSGSCLPSMVLYWNARDLTVR